MEKKLRERKKILKRHSQGKENLWDMHIIAGEKWMDVICVFFRIFLEAACIAFFPVSLHNKFISVTFFLPHFLYTFFG